MDCCLLNNLLILGVNCFISRGWVTLEVHAPRRTSSFLARRWACGSKEIVHCCPLPCQIKDTTMFSSNIDISKKPAQPVPYYKGLRTVRIKVSPQRKYSIAHLQTDERSLQQATERFTFWLCCVHPSCCPAKLKRRQKENWRQACEEMRGRALIGPAQ